MSSLKVNWPDVETAFERNSPGLQSYIDRATGEVIVLIEGDPEDADKSAAISDNPDGYLQIEPASSREQYRWMERFVASVEEKDLADRLLIAIDGKGAFRRFKDVLLSFPVERERWFNYRADLLHHHINQWFEAKDLESDLAIPWGDVVLPPEPEQPLVRTTATGEGPADVLRKQVKALVDVLPAGELHSARVFLEYLRDRGSAQLSAGRTKIDPRRPFRRYDMGSGDLHEDETSGDDQVRNLQDEEMDASVQDEAMDASVQSMREEMPSDDAGESISEQAGSPVIASSNLS
ncbi:MAG: hypothetical protein KAI47_22540 [Deltaproteobacteria bacterium]|nr:hypothetical protein [Deltaproteobacteria bacterium]